MSRLYLLWFVLAFSMGSLFPLQAGMNAQLRQALGSPFRASLINFIIGTVLLLCLALLLQADHPAEPRRVAWWAWLGGVLGATHVTGAILLAPRLGAAALFAGMVAGQLTTAAAIDHFGLVGYPAVPLSWPRVLGVVLLVAGALLVLRR